MGYEKANGLALIVSKNLEGKGLFRDYLFGKSGELGGVSGRMWTISDGELGSDFCIGSSNDCVRTLSRA